MKKYILLGMLTISVLLNLPKQEAISATTGWITAHELQRISGKIFKREKQLPYAIQCKAIKGIQTRKTILLKVEYRPNLGKTKWVWGWGSSYKRGKIRVEKNGYRQVSYDRFTRIKTGYTAQCGIFHKP